MMRKLLHQYYPFLINIYTVWILYLMFFAFSREEGGTQYMVRALPFESITYVLKNSWSNWDIFKNLGGNILMFVPYGFLGILYPKLNRYLPLLITFFISINFLEFLQLFSRRGYAEFDDVMLNSIGMTTGFLIYKKFFFVK